MSNLEAAIRGAVIALLLLLAAFAARPRRTHQRLLGAAFSLSVAAYALTSSPSFDGWFAWWLVPFRVVSMATTVTFWLWTRAIFDDDFRPTWLHAAIWLAVAAVSLGCLLNPRANLFLALDIVSIGFIGLGIWEALSGRGIDLVEGRRRLRPVLALGAAASAGIVVVAELFWHGALVSTPGSLINAAGLLMMAFIFAFTNPTQTAPDAAAIPAPTPAAAPQADARDAPVLTALARLMDEDKVFRESGLSVGALAARLDLPEYRLRRLINGQLGHRNFQSFVNGYRLAEAQAALADPSQAEVPILTIALDAGFQSIGPFNRAFKAATGMTPTDYRRARLNGTAPKAAEATGRI